MMITGYQIGPKLIELLGLPKRTKTFTLRIEPDEAVVITIEYYPDERDINGILQLLHAEYELIARCSEVTNLASTAKEFDLAKY